MKIGVNYTRVPSPKQFKALVESFEKDGATVFKVKDPINYPDCDLIFTHGVPKRALSGFGFMNKLFKQQSKRGGSILVMDGGYVKRDSDVGSDKGHYSLGFNGLNGRAKFVCEDMPSNRWDKLGVALKPWRKSGKKDYILVCGQLGRDSSVQHITPSYEKWLQKTVLKIKNHTSREVIYRPHPKPNPVLLSGTTLSKNLKEPLEKDFKNCHLVVAANSNSLVEASVHGIPALAFDEGSMVWDHCLQAPPNNQGLREIENPRTFNRKIWANNLAYSQWNKQEMASGEAWQHLKTILNSGIKLKYENSIATNTKL